jgi:hypothetical protein
MSLIEVSYNLTIKPIYEQFMKIIAYFINIFVMPLIEASIETVVIIKSSTAGIYQMVVMLYYITILSCFLALLKCWMKY